MLDQLNDQDDTELDDLETPEPELDEVDGEQPETEQQPEAEEDEVVVSFGDDEPEAKEGPAPTWVKELRQQNRELKRKLKELETVAQPRAPELGPKPTLEACDYDADKFEAELLSWNARKAKADEEAQKRKQAAEQSEKEWQGRLQTYSQQKAALKVRDFDDAEDAVREVLNTIQQGIILQAADDPAKLVYALGRNPSKAAELAAERDPVRFAAKVAKMEVQLKVTTRKPAVQPESRPTGSGTPPATSSARLEKLKADAERTGDFTQYFAAKRKLKGT